MEVPRFLQTNAIHVPETAIPCERIEGSACVDNLGMHRRDREPISFGKMVSTDDHNLLGEMVGALFLITLEAGFL